MGGKVSKEAHNRWQRENYLHVSVSINRSDGLEFSALCKKNGDTQAEILRAAVYEYLGKPVPPSKARF